MRIADLFVIAQLTIAFVKPPRFKVIAVKLTPSLSLSRLSVVIAPTKTPEPDSLWNTNMTITHGF